jgi:branched-chain amino acid transport system substrate-binding protein
MKISHLFLLLGMLAIFSWLMKHESKKKITSSGNIIKVGVIAPFSGPHTGKGMSGLQGVKIGQALLPYLDNGDAIELVLVNDLENTELSVQALRKLVQEHQVACVLVFSDSDSVLAMAKVADRYKTPILAVIASHPDVTKGSS